ncbi:hypothetical protein D3C73_1348450 [compost metagenome]
MIAAGPAFLHHHPRQRQPGAETEADRYFNTLPRLRLRGIHRTGELDSSRTGHVKQQAAQRPEHGEDQKKPQGRTAQRSVEDADQAQNR